MCRSVLHCKGRHKHLTALDLGEQRFYVLAGLCILRGVSYATWDNVPLATRIRI